MGRPREWWPLADADPVPGDPDALAGLGQHMANAAAEIEHLARTLPRLSASEVWDSDAGSQFRASATTTATELGKAHGRFQAVATALGSSTVRGAGYAAVLQHCQDKADAAANAVIGTLTSSGSEVARRRAWTALLDATGGLDPARPVPPPVAGSTGGTAPVYPGISTLLAPPGWQAGPFPLASPGVIPPPLPGFASDPPTVTALKSAYNTAIGTLRTSADAVSKARAAQSAAAHSAALLISRTVSADGLNNASGFMHWLDHVTDDVTGYVSAHWVTFTRNLADIAGEIATECGLIAMVLAFIPGMQELAAAFETVALLAQFVSFACHLTLLATGNGGLLDVVVDGIGLVTFGLGKGLIGAAVKTAKLSEGARAVYQSAVGDGSITRLIDAGNTTSEWLRGADNWSYWDTFAEEMKKTLSVRPVFAEAAKVLRSGAAGRLLADQPLGQLERAARLAFSFNSPEVGFALHSATEAVGEMPVAQGVALATSDRIDCYFKLFRVTQVAGVSTDLTSKLDSALNAGHLTLPGYDSIKSWPGRAGG